MQGRLWCISHHDHDTAVIKAASCKSKRILRQPPTHEAHEEIPKTTVRHEDEPD